MGVASEVTLGGWGFTSEGGLVPGVEWREEGGGEGGEGGSGELLLERDQKCVNYNEPTKYSSDVLFAEGADGNTHTSLQLPGPGQEVEEAQEEAEVGSPPCCFHL